MKNRIAASRGLVMVVSLEEIEQQARSLVAEERAQLAETLLESLSLCRTNGADDRRSAWRPP
jgi:hypothetical protein